MGSLSLTGLAFISPTMRLLLLLTLSLHLLLLLVEDAQSSPRRNLRRTQKRKSLRRGRQEEYSAGGLEDNLISDSGSGSDIANDCDPLTEIGAMMVHAKELAWCLENDPELELGLYAPLVACIKGLRPKPIEPVVVEDPCDPYVECKPECVTSNECPSDKACLNQHCVDPCPGVCGAHTSCRVISHTPQCTCDPGYTGNAFIACQRINTPPPRPRERPDPCYPSPCGSNALCTDRNGALSCRCIPDYFGDPRVACRPECTINADCPSNKACQNLHCVDPCPGLCGTNAQCRVINHIPTCTCFEGYEGDPYIGDPFTACRKKPIPIAPVIEEDPCDPNLCVPSK